MKILQIFNRYGNIGGEELAVGWITEELSEHHEFRAITFNSHDWLAKAGIFDRFRQLLLMVWNPASIAKVREQLDEFRPDVILLHNIMPIGSAGLYLFLKSRQVPVIHYIHNFRPFSVSGYCWGGNKLLPQGLKQNFIPEILAGAWQESCFKTAWYGLLIWLLHRTGVFQKIDGWIAISQFMKSSFVEAGIEECKIRVISHSWTPQCSDEELARLTNRPEDPMILFLGRLTEEKGLKVLLDAWETVEKSTDIGRLVIAGDGPLANEVKQRCARMKRATSIGFKSGENKKQLLRDCTALVVPSIWWEPLGLVLYEAFDYGKPVLAARSGGIVDHVEHGQNGWLHKPGDTHALGAQMLQAIGDTASCYQMGQNGRKLLLERTTQTWIDQFNDFAKTIQANSSSLLTNPTIATPYDGKVGAPGDHALASSNLQSPISLSVYLADQNPGYDRSFGISRMSQVIIEALQDTKQLEIKAISSKTSQQAPGTLKKAHILPWGTRSKWVRLLTDHFHPLFAGNEFTPDIYYFPKGYLPWLGRYCQPSVVTIHDTIIQYDKDHYPKWRTSRDYAYWEMMLKHTLKNAGTVLTVSESSKLQICAFIKRYALPEKEIHVTYEPCLYETTPQPLAPTKKNHVIHLASCEPHKRSAHLIRWWHEAESQGRILPTLHLIGQVPNEVSSLLASAHTIVKRPFLEDIALQAAYQEAQALILPSEIEGFGLPALEAYYLGTPVCYVKDTSVEEILGVATSKGAFTLDDPNSLFAALEEVVAMSPEEIHLCGLKLRETYAAEKVAQKMIRFFRDVKMG